MTYAKIILLLLSIGAYLIEVQRKKGAFTDAENAQLADAHRRLGAQLAAADAALARVRADPDGVRVDPNNTDTWPADRVGSTRREPQPALPQGQDNPVLGNGGSSNPGRDGPGA